MSISNILEKNNLDIYASTFAGTPKLNAVNTNVKNQGLSCIPGSTETQIEGVLIPSKDKDSVSFLLSFSLNCSVINSTSGHLRYFLAYRINDDNLRLLYQGDNVSKVYYNGSIYLSLSFMDFINVATTYNVGDTIKFIVRVENLTDGEVFLNPDMNVLNVIEVSKI